MRNILRALLLLAAVVGALSLLPRGAAAGITSISALDIPNRLDTLAEGTGGLRRMILFDIQSDSAVTVSELAVWLEGTNLKSLGNAAVDGYQRSLKSFDIRFSDPVATVGNLAFNGAILLNEYYSQNPENNRVYAYSQIVFGQTSQIFLNLSSGHNYFMITYNFDAPNSQPAGATRTLAGERYNVRLDYAKTTSGSMHIANLMGPYVIVTGTILGTTIEVDTTIYFNRSQIGIPVDPVVIMALKLTAIGTSITWNDYLIRGEGTGDETRISRLFVYEDTNGDFALNVPGPGVPGDTLLDTVDVPFVQNDGQAYHIFPTPVTLAAGTARIFFFCYEFDSNAPDAVNNGFRLSVVNLGGYFRIMTPDDLSTLVSPTVNLFPLPPGINVAIGLQDPPIQYFYTSPILTERYVAMQIKLTALNMDAAIDQVTFFYTVTSTARSDTLFALELWMDANNAGLGSVDSSDVLLSTISRTEILASPSKFVFNLTQALQVRSASFANIILVAVFTDQATAAYGFTLFGDGVKGNFDFVRFYPTPAPLYSNWMVFTTTPPLSPTPTPTPTPTVTVVDPGAGDNGNTNGGSGGNDTGVNIPGSLYQNPGSGCFVATASFGSMACFEVESLCAFRDGALATPQAAALFGLYYSVGPGLADSIRYSPATRAFIRGQLLPLIRLAD
ncbi:MAG: CFI-box-CTERM domain-containing protein [Candidatus Brocadiia bacterium]